MRQFFLFFSRSREFDDDMRAAIGRIGDLQCASMRFDDGLHDGETEAGAAVLGGEERIHRLLERIFGKTGAGIAEVQPRLA